MLFTSSIFLFIFMPLLLLFYFIARGKQKNYVLLVFSLIFYAWGGPKLLLLMISIVGINYVIALLIDRTSSKKIKKTYS